MLVIVTGNIGSGKTTFIKSLSDVLTRQGIKNVPLYEPVNKWLAPHNMLNILENKGNNRHIAQLYLYLTILNQLNDVDHNQVILLERGCINGINEFCNNEDNIIALHAYRECCELEQKLGIDIIVDMGTPLDVCLERIHKRGREGELMDVNVRSYISLLNEHHKNFITLCTAIAKDKVISYKDNIEEMISEVHTKISNTVLFDTACSRIIKNHIIPKKSFIHQ